MKTYTIFRMAFLTIVVIVLNGCAPSPIPVVTIEMPTPTLVLPTETPVPSTPMPQGKTIQVTNTADSGAGTLRQALQDAQNGDTILFDPSVFPPESPETITVTSGLPQLGQGNLTIDASEAGVILDGSQLPRDTWIPGLEIVSDRNTIRGLQVINFTGTGIVVAFHGRNNTIGGDRNIGAGPIGEGNLASGNDFGIGVWDFASNNIVTGNIVGTDIRGEADFGNRNSGVWVTEGGTKNIIGPDNVIAYNGKCGIEVSDSSGNTLTQNSIHNNGGVGICLVGGGNTGLSAPFIVGFDLIGGLIRGSSCANCTVEIFSDSSDEGAIYEGQTITDAKGVFTFNKGAPFIGPHLTAITTDMDGNTSEFSLTADTLRSLILQRGNDLPMTLFKFKGSRELADNRIGVGHYSPDTPGPPNLNFQAEEVIASGIKRIDIALTENEPPIDWSFSETEFPPEYDRFIDVLIENGIAINHMLHFWDKAGHPGGEGLARPRFQNQEQVDDFLKYVRFVVGHFKGRADYYTIWSEPDNCGQEGLKCILPQDYINLVRQVIPVIREEDPEAKIVSAPNVLFFAREDLFTFLQSDVVKQFDVISWHPIYDVTPNHSFYGNYYYEYPAIIQEIKQTASAHGFTGEYWGTELQWNSRKDCNLYFPGCEDYIATDPRAQGMAETDLQVAKYYARGIVMQLGMDVGVGLDVHDTRLQWTYPTIRNLNTVMAGNRPLEIPVEIESDATNITSYGFTLPNGERLFALWTDGVAVDDDPGVSATLTFPDSSAESVIGIDMLHAFEQELITEAENGELVIRNLLVKDYPIILRITASTSTVTPRPIPAEPADVIFHNGTIITIEESQPLAEAIALRNGLIQAVGTNEEILALQGADTAVVNLEGKTMMPGFVDPHTHILNDAKAHLGLNLDEAQDLALKNGITTLADMYVDEGLLEALRSLESAGDLRVRTGAYLVATNNCGEPLGDWYTAYPPTDEFGEMLRIGGVKLFLDGGTCGPAAVSEVVKTNEGMGTLFLSDEELAEIVGRADSAGYQIAIHALGDRAVDQAIDALNAVIDSPGNPERHRIEHALFMVDGQFSRFSEMGVNPVIFGYWPTCVEDGTGYTENWKHNIRRWRELADANPGLVIAAKTDNPWMGPPSPLLELYSLTTLREVAEDGSICEPAEWLADRTLTIREALPMVTINAAYMLFREDEVGSLEPGKLADLIVLSGNPLDNPDGIKDLSVLVTMVSGKTEYCAAGWEALCP